MKISQIEIAVLKEACERLNHIQKTLLNTNYSSDFSRGLVFAISEIELMIEETIGSDND